MTDDPEVVLTSQSDSVISGFLTKARPSLIVRCSERSLSAYIVTGMATDVENAASHFTVRYRVDTSAAVTESDWRESTDHEALYSPSPSSFVERLMLGRSILVEWTPFNANPVLARFAIGGLEPYRASLIAACPGELSAESAIQQAKTRDSLNAANEREEDSLRAAREAYAASPEGKSADAIAAVDRFMAAHSRSSERLAMTQSANYDDAELVGAVGCVVRFALSFTVDRTTTRDTATVDLRTLLLPDPPKSSFIMSGFRVILATANKTKSIESHIGHGERPSSVSMYNALSFNFDERDDATEFARLMTTAITACRSVH